MKSIEGQVFLILEANEHCKENSKDDLHGYETIGFVKTKAKAIGILDKGGNYKDSKMPRYLCQLVFKIK